MLAVVTQSDPIELEKGSLTSSLLSSEPKPGFKDCAFTMLESPIFYEPCKAVLNFQKMKADFPFIGLVLGKSEKKEAAIQRQRWLYNNSSSQWRGIESEN